MRTYNKKVTLDQRPRAFIVESSILAEAADVAAPILKLSPEYRVAEGPARDNVPRTWATENALVRGEPSFKRKIVPGAEPCADIYERHADTGHILDLVFPTLMLTPYPGGHI